MKVLITISHSGETITRAIEVTDRATLVYSVAAEVIDFVGKEAAVQHHYEMVHYQLENPDGSVIASGIPQFQADLGIPDGDGVLKIKLEITPKKFEAIRTAINQLLETDTVKNREKAKQCIKKTVEDGTIALHLPALREYLQKNAKDDKGKQKPVVNEVRSWLNEATPPVELSIEGMALLIEELREQEPNVEFIKKALHGVTSLSIPSSGIRVSGATALAEVLKSNTTLISLELGGNRIGVTGAQALAEALKSNATLAFLDLKCNQIETPGATALAEALKSNTTLTSLDLAANQIRDTGATALAESLESNASLIFLDLESNQIGDPGAKAFAKSLKSNTTLTSLGLGRNQIGDPGAKAFAESLQSNATLTSLDLKYNQIGDPGAKALVESLKSNFSLISLNLPNSSDIGKKTDFYLQRNKNRLATATQYLERTFVEDVTPEINLIASLTEIIGDYLTPTDLTSECDMSPAAEDVVLKGTFETIRIAISNLLETDTRENRENAKQCIKKAAQDGTIVFHLAALREYLQKNAKDDKGKQKPLVSKVYSWLNETPSRFNLSIEDRALLIQELQKEKPDVEFIKNTLQGVTSLSLMNSEIRDAGATALAEVLKSNATLISLDLGKNLIGSLGAQALADALKSNATLAYLNLKYNQINESGAQYLAESLKSNTTLTSLDLSYNEIRDPGVTELALALESNTTLISLDLGGNEIGDSGATALAKALKSNTSLISLYLQFNQIGVLGVIKIAEALKSNATLTSLNLSYSQIGTSGAKHLAEALKSNATLTALNLSYSQIGIPGAKYLAEVLKSSVTLSSLDLGGNQIGAPGTQALTEALKSNFSLISLDLSNSSDIGKKIEYLERNKKRLAKATEYLETTFVKEVTPEINFVAPLTELIGDYLTPTDLTSECDMSPAVEGTFETIRIAISSLLETDTRKNREKAKQCIKKAAQDGTIVFHLPALREYLQKNAKDDKGKQQPVVNEVRSWLNEATPPVKLSIEDRELLIQKLREQEPNIEFIKNILHGVTSLSLLSSGISDSGATALAEALKSNATLISLNLGYNQIRDTGVKALAEALKSNAILISLELGGNQIRDTGATEVAEALKSNVTLTSLGLSYNQIRDPGATELAKSLKSNATLTSLNLRSNRIRDPGATAFAEALKSNFSLISLNLPNSSDIGKKTDFYLQRNKNRLATATQYLETTFVEDVTPEINLIAPLTEIIGDYLTPTDLTSECDMSPAAEDVVFKGTFETIRIAISSLLETDTGKNREKVKQCIKMTAQDGTIEPHLAALREYLQKNAKDDKGKQQPVVNEVRSWLNDATPPVELSIEDRELLIQELSEQEPNIEFIKNTLHGVTSLSLLSSGISDSGATALAEALKSNATLIFLELGRNHIGALGATALAEALKSNTTLYYLNLNYNEIEESGAKHLAKALKSNSTLRMLFLRASYIGSLGAKHLAEALKSNATLTNLDLAENHIGDLGATEIAESLKSNATLICLTLAFNQIGVPGVTRLTEALKTNATLASLNLRNSEIGDLGVTELAEVLKSNATLNFLDLGYSQIGISGAQHLAEALKSNTTLSSLDLGGNQIGVPGATALTEALKSNFSLISLGIPYSYSSGIGEITDYLQRNKKRLAKATEYLETTFVKDVTQEINLIVPLTELIGDYLIPTDLTSECDITGSAALMGQLGFHQTYSEKEKESLEGTLEGSPKNSSVSLG